MAGIVLAAFICFCCTHEQAEAVIDFLGGDMEYVVPAEGGEVVIQFECDQSWYTSVLLPVSEIENDWYVVSGMNGEPGHCTVTLSLLPNPRETERSLEIRINAGSTKSALVKVVQLAQEKDVPGPVVEDTSIDKAIEASVYDVTARSAYLRGVFNNVAPEGFQRPQYEGFMISSEYSTPQEIYQNGQWINAFRYKTTGEPDEVLTAYVSGLDPAATYYLIACLDYSNDEVYRYSPVYTFSTAAVRTDCNGYEAVDLGLSVKWARKNVGAINEYAVGNYYSWGDPESRNSFRTGEYRFYTGTVNGWSQFSKYVTYINCAPDGSLDNLVRLLPEDDAAHVNMGGTWRMPLASEFKELVEKCTWQQHHAFVDGKEVLDYYIVTGPSGNSMILPATGTKVSDVLFPDSGRYIGAEIDVNDSSQTTELYFNASESYLASAFRGAGYAVRAVTD